MARWSRCSLSRSALRARPTSFVVAVLPSLRRHRAWRIEFADGASIRAVASVRAFDVVRAARRPGRNRQRRRRRHHSQPSTTPRASPRLVRDRRLGAAPRCRPATGRISSRSPSRSCPPLRRQARDRRRGSRLVEGALPACAAEYQRLRSRLVDGREQSGGYA